VLDEAAAEGPAPAYSAARKLGSPPLRPWPQRVDLLAGPQSGPGVGYRTWNFYQTDLVTGRERQVTDLKPGYLMQSFDISEDGKQIIFDRFRDNSNIVLMDLAR
jgi:hypothetical protein